MRRNTAPTFAALMDERARLPGQPVRLVLGAGTDAPTVLEGAISHAWIDRPYDGRTRDWGEHELWAEARVREVVLDG